MLTFGQTYNMHTYRHDKSFPQEQVALADLYASENGQVSGFDILKLLKCRRPHAINQLDHQYNQQKHVHYPPA